METLRAPEPIPKSSAAHHPWDGFLSAPENALAHAGILALARGEPGLSPLVVHGPSGVGKSRLLAGLVGEWLARNPGAAVAHVAAEEFAADCAEAAGAPGGWAELRSRFRDLDLFVIEDLHDLQRAPLALAELSHTLDALDETGAAVAVSARAGPGQWSGLPARLVSRLSGGLSVRVDPPGIDTRRRYALERARQRGLALTSDAVESAAASADGFRTIDGLLARLALEAKTTRRPIDAPMVANVLEEPASGMTLDAITKAVASHFRVSLRDLRSASRRAAVVAPRHLAIYLARVHTGQSFAALGAYFGGRDTKTIRHACAAAEKRLAADPALAAAVEAIIPGRPIDLSG
jgi:chromosomal replication initiator protein